MIEAKELRVGNKVTFTIHLPIGYYHPIPAITEITEIESGNVQSTHGAYKYHDIAPVPLTETILVKCGGKKSGENLYIFEDEDKDIPALLVLLSDDKFYLSTEKMDKLSVPITSVHHFQNLYYMLKGKNIDVKF